MRSQFLLTLMILSPGCTQRSETIAEIEHFTSATSASTMPAPVAIETFSPDPQLIARLGEPVPVKTYFLSPPIGYREVRPITDNPSPSTTQSFGWSGEQREDGSSPTLQLAIITPNVAEPLPALEIVLPKIVDSFSRRRTNWKPTEAKFGMLGGLRFGRIEWTGTRPENGRDMAGIIYIALDDQTIVQLQTQDYLANGETLRINEAALLTFRKK